MTQNNNSSSLEADAPELISASSHAERQPDMVQPSRQRERVSKQQAAIRAIQNQVARQKREQMISDLDKAMSDHSKVLEDLARKHAVTIDYVQKLVNNAPTFKKKRAPNVHNAMLHMKAMEMNEDSFTGHRKKLPELQKLVAGDEELKNMTEEEKKEIVEELEAFRKLKQSGARPSNRSATTDYRAVVDNLTTEFQHLSDRTGACAVAFLSRGHLDDTFEPVYICSPNAGNFVNETLKMGPSDVARLLEQWACSVARKKAPVDTLASMRIEVAALILDGLKAAARVDKISMSYANYDRQIVQSHCVKLVGWTYKKFISPQEISTVDDIRTLRDALQVGSCKWVRMSKHEVNHHMKGYERQLENGEIAKKPRKERSDKGTKRKHTRPEEGETISSNSETEERPSKKSQKRRGKENSKVLAGPGKEARGRQTRKSTQTRPDKAARRKLKTQLPPLQSKSVISDSGSEPDSDQPDLDTPLNVAHNPHTDSTISNANAQPHHTPCSPWHTPNNPSTETLPSNTSAYPETVVSHPLALSSIQNNNQNRDSIAGDAGYPGSLPFLSLQGMKNLTNISDLPLETTPSGNHNGLHATLPRSAHLMAPAYPPHSHSDAFASRSTSFTPADFPTFSNEQFTTGLFPSQAPFIPIGSPHRPTPNLQMAPAHRGGLSLPPDMLPHRFSAPETLTSSSQITPLSSSGLSLPPDLQDPSFTNSNTYDLWPYNFTHFQ